MSMYDLRLGDCLEVMPALPENSVDTIICDPPYMIDFMGKSFDKSKDNIAGRVEVWRECLRVAKPGAMMLAFGGDRTHHRLMVAIEDAGWEIRTCIYWIFASGFPKSHQFYKQMGETGEPFRGYGTALSPAAEIIVMAMKPLDETFAQNAQKWGVAGLAIDRGRIGIDLAAEPDIGSAYYAKRGQEYPTQNSNGSGGQTSFVRAAHDRSLSAQGRWPKNVILDEAAAAQLDQMSGERKSSGSYTRGVSVGNKIYGAGMGNQPAGARKEDFNDTGGASRFFYCAKSSASERNLGLEGMEAEKVNDGRDTPIDNAYQRGETLRRNTNPCVKPISLLRYLCRLTATPTGGVVLDPFMGSGSTGVAAMQEDRRFIGIELEPEYHAIAQRRLERAAMQLSLFAEGEST